jgi:two-component system response regulator AtoC
MHDMPPAEIIYGSSPGMILVRAKLERIANTDVPVLLQGESGTGKDIFARCIHQYSDRRHHGLVKVTCPAIPSALVESELFGYEKGAFTGAYSSKRGRVELADNGSLFLDEVGGLVPSVQAKLLQFLQDGTFMRVGGQDQRCVNTRLICADNGNLRQQTEEGAFRLDFLFRINAITIELPPLRQRATDIPSLTDYFFARYTKMFRCAPKPLSQEILQLMQKYHWPGNIRQLENMIRCYVLVDSEEALISEMASSMMRWNSAQLDLSHPFSLKAITQNAINNIEREIILKVLQAHGWNRQRTAKWLNISYRSLFYKLEETGICKSQSYLRHRAKATPPAAEQI